MQRLIDCSCKECNRAWECYVDFIRTRAFLVFAMCFDDGEDIFYITTA